MSAKYWVSRGTRRTLLAPLRGRTQFSKRAGFALFNRNKQTASCGNHRRPATVPVSGAPKTNSGNQRRARNGCHLRYAQEAAKPQTRASAYSARSRSPKRRARQKNKNETIRRIARCQRLLASASWFLAFRGGSKVAHFQVVRGS